MVVTTDRAATRGGEVVTLISCSKVGPSARSSRRFMEASMVRGRGCRQELVFIRRGVANLVTGQGPQASHKNMKSHTDREVIREWLFIRLRV